VDNLTVVWLSGCVMMISGVLSGVAPLVWVGAIMGVFAIVKS